MALVSFGATAKCSRNFISGCPAECFVRIDGGATMIEYSHGCLRQAIGFLVETYRDRADGPKALRLIEADVLSHFEALPQIDPNCSGPPCHAFI